MVDHLMAERLRQAKNNVGEDRKHFLINLAQSIQLSRWKEL